MNYIIAECPQDNDFIKYINKNVESSIDCEWCDYAEKPNCTIFLIDEDDQESFFALFAQMSTYNRLPDNGLYGWIKNNGLVDKCSKSQLLMVVKDANGSMGRNINVITPDNDCYSIDYKSENNFGLMEKSCDKTYVKCDIDRLQYLGFTKSEIIRNPLIGSLHSLAFRNYNMTAYIWVALILLLIIPLAVWMSHIRYQEYADLRQPWLLAVATILALVIPLFNSFVFFKKEYEHLTAGEKIRNYVSMFTGWWFVFMIIVGIIGCCRIFF